MKKISSGHLAVTFAGAFLGAGYVSGQELYQFFGTFGKYGYIGAALSMVVLGVFGVLLIDLARLTGTEALDEIVVPNGRTGTKKIVGGLQMLLLVGVITIMTAAAGALLQQLFGLPVWAGSLILIVIASVAALFGLKGMISTFAVVVPIVAVATVAYSVAAIRAGQPSFTIVPKADRNVLLPNWPTAALTYAGYNIFGTIGILTPFGSRMRGRKQIVTGIVGGTVILLVVATAILTAMAFIPSSISAELPMLSLAMSFNRPLAFVYGFLILAAIFGTMVSSLVATLTYLKTQSTFLTRHSNWMTIVLGIVSFFLSLIGFGSLIGSIYPVFGYLSIAALVLIVINYVRARKKEKGDLKSAE